MTETTPGSTGPEQTEAVVDQERAATPQPTDAPESPAGEAGEPTPDVGDTATTDAAAATEPVDSEPANGGPANGEAANGEAAENADPAENTEPAENAEPTEAGAPVEGDEPAESDDKPADTEPAEASVAQQPADSASAARPTPRPTPKPSALAGAPKPTALRRPAPASAPAGAEATPAASTPAPAVAPVVHDAAEAAAAEAFGRVEDDGTVYVREAAGERVVGQFPGVPTSEALGLYVRRYLDLAAKVTLFEARLDSADLSVREIDQTLAKLAEETAEPAAVGDLDSLRTRVEGLRTRAAERRALLEQARAEAKAAAVQARTEIVEAAESIAATEPGKMQWRPAGEELRSLLDRWKEAQRSGPRIDRPTEESLWKRFSHARTAFDRERRHFFADLEQRNTSAKAVKEDLVAQAEALQNSTDWGPTAGVYRDLMAQWKSAGRASRKDDDALWARFRAAQDTFFAARDAQNAAVDAEYAQNLEVKEALLAEAEGILPITDLAAAKAALRGIQERWEEAGKVPRGDVQRVEGRLRAVEAAVREADQAQWVRTNPETRARAEGAAAQLQSAIEGLEADLDAARAGGDTRKIAELESAIAARRSWLEQVVRAAEDLRG